MSSLSVVFPFSSMSLIYTQLWKYFHLVVFAFIWVCWVLQRVLPTKNQDLIVFSDSELMFWFLIGPFHPPKALEKDTLVYLSLSWWTGVFPSLSLRKSQLSENHLGPSFTLSRPKFTLTYPRTYYALSSTPAQMSGLLSRSNTLSPRQLFTSIALRSFFTCLPEISPYLFWIQLYLKYFICCILARTSMYIQREDTVLVFAQSHYSSSSCLSASSRL